MLITNPAIDLARCSINNWYEQFEKIAIKSYIVKLDSTILDYLRDDLLILPKECNIETSNTLTAASELDFVGDPIDFDEDDSEKTGTPEFEEFSKNLMVILGKLGGSAFIKANWHCALDAKWITAGQTLKVKDLVDIYQLLKASDKIKEDLNQPNVAEYCLVFKKWVEIHPGTEFRCFVKNHNLIAISPRDWPEFHEHMTTQKHDIIKDIASIFKEKIKKKFPLANYCFDVVRSKKDHVKLLDFSPFNEKHTNPLAFEWSQLESEDFILQDDEVDDPEFRYLATDVGIQPTSRNNFGIPSDIVEMFQQLPPQSQEQDMDDINRSMMRTIIDKVHDDEEMD